FGRALKGEEISPAEGGRVRRKSRFNIPLSKRPWIAAGFWGLLLGGAAWGANRAGLFAPSPGEPGGPRDSVPAVVPPAPPPAPRGTGGGPPRNPRAAAPVVRDTPTTAAAA